MTGYPVTSHFSIKIRTNRLMISVYLTELGIGNLVQNIVFILVNLPS